MPVSPSGVADVELTSDAGDAQVPGSDQSELLVSQFAWTLHQDPSIKRFQVSIDGQRVQLDGETDFSVEYGHEYAPYISGADAQLFGLQDGLMVGGSPRNLEHVTGPFGQTEYGLRSVSPTCLPNRSPPSRRPGRTLGWARSRTATLIPRS